MPDICKHIVRGLIGIVCSSFGLAGCYGSGSMNGESSMKFSSLDLSQDRYMYMGLHLQKAPQDVVPCTDVDLSTGHNAKENCWVSSRREGNTYNGYVKRYYSKQKQVPYRICVYHDFGSSSDDAIKRYVDELICYIKKKSDGGSDLREVPDGTGGKSTQWSWTYLSWEFSMRLRIDDSTGAHGLEISIVCPVYLKAAKEELDN